MISKTPNKHAARRPYGTPRHLERETLVRASSPEILQAMRTPQHPRTDPISTLPEGYRLIDSDGYIITERDLVFMGGARNYWMPARRAGEVGEFRRFSAAFRVASPTAH